MSKSAQSVQRSAYLMLGFVFVFGGLGFGIYLWNDTKIYDAQPESASGGGSAGARTNVQRFAPSLSLKIEDRGATGLHALVTLTNTSNAHLFIPDLLGIEPLYSVALKYAPAKTGELHELPRAPALQGRVADAAAVPFNSDRDVVVELLPGRSHVVVVPLSEWYVPKPGHYELRVAFRPMDMVAAGDGQVLPRFNSTTASAVLAFDYPLEKPGAAKGPEVPAQNVEAPTPAK